MDYAKPAVKVFVSQVLSAPSFKDGRIYHKLGNFVFQRVWLQGVLVQGAVESELILDDGSGTVIIEPSQCSNVPPLGSYVLVIGNLRSSKEVKAHKMVDLSGDPQRESMWFLEVIDANVDIYKRVPSATN